MRDPWPMVHAERSALVADLERLDAKAWETPSLCEGWTVHDVAAHLVHTAMSTRLGFIAELARARFDFDRHNEDGVLRHRGATPEETLAALRRAGRRTTTPPAPLATRIVEEVVHGEDIRRPLGIARDYPTEAVVRALRYQVKTSPAMGGGKDLASVARLVATDADVAEGEGPEVRGPVLALLMVVARRRDFVAELSGPGVEALTATI